MTAYLKPYPDYKPSGIEWLGDVPAHWEVRRTRSFASILNGATPSSNTPSYWDGEITWITPQDLGALENQYIENSARKITHEGYESCGTSIASAGALVISTRAPIGYVAILSVPACVNQGCRLIIPNSTSVLPEYLYYSFLIARSEFNSLGQGTTFAELSKGTLANFHIPLPPLPEQTAIARYLDHVDERIQRYIRGKQKLIDLLEEEKQAVIHRAVTRGLDPNVRLKPSGVEWLGDVPEHWEVRKLKTLSTRVQNGSTPSTEESSYYAKDGLPWYSPPSLNRSIFVGHPTRYLSDRAVEEGKARPITPPALAVSVIGNVGKCALMLQPGATNQQITCFELVAKLCNPHFVIMQFRFAEESLIASASSATIAILDSGVLKATKLAIPLRTNRHRCVSRQGHCRY